MFVLSLIGFSLFFLTVAIHISTFFNVNLLHSCPWLWVLHGIAIFFFFAMAISAGRGMRGLRGAERRQAQKIFWKSMMGRMPIAGRWLMSAVFTYAIINFVLFIVHTSSASPSLSYFEEGGKYYAEAKYSPAKQCSKEEFDEYDRWLLRCFSGHWMILFLVPSLYYLSPRPRRIS
jgi:hypothetical protein